MMLRLVCVVALVALVSGKVVVKPTELTDADWTRMLEGEWLVEFYAPWCPACKAMAFEWEKVAGWGEELGFSVAEVDVTKNPGLSGRFLVMALPTIFHVKDGIFRLYSGDREENEFVSFVDDKKYEAVDPIPWWKSPSTPQMGAVGLFFKASALVQDLHSRMTAEYGLPVWASYAVFALATILVGLIIGLIIVFLCDVVLPPQPPSHPPQPLFPDSYQEFSKAAGTDEDSDPVKDDRQQVHDQDGEEDNKGPVRQRTAVSKEVKL